VLLPSVSLPLRAGAIGVSYLKAESPRAFGSFAEQVRSNDHAKRFFPRADRDLRGHHRRFLGEHDDTNAGGGVVVSSRLGLARGMASRLARLLLGATHRRRDRARWDRPGWDRRFTAGGLRAAARQGLGSAALGWPVVGSRTLGVMHDIGRPRRAPPASRRGGARNVARDGARNVARDGARNVARGGARDVARFANVLAVR
jgi:hypothetical protein